MFALWIGSVTAWGYVWFGNPTGVVLEIDGVGSADAEIDAVRMHACGGGYTEFPVGGTFDLAEPLTLEIDAGAWCGASVRWGSALTLTHAGWTAVYDESHTSVTIDQDPEDTSTPLGPLDVTSGTFSGIAPRLRIRLADG